MKNIARKLSALLLVFVVSAAALCPAFAATASLPSLPSGQCVVDDANVLSSSTVQTITDLNAQLESSCSGARIGVLTVEYALYGNDSLKGKRRVANSLKQKVRNTFNVAIAEAGTEDSLVRLRLKVVSISNSERHLQSRMDKCLAMMEAVCTEEMTWSDLEMMEAD